MHILDATPESLDAAANALPAGSPIAMLSLVRFREQADCGPGSDLPPCSGREAYLVRYREAFGRIMAGKGVEPLYVGMAVATLVPADGETWDAVAVVRYPDFATLRGMLVSEAYRREAAPHRLAALADWRFVATVTR